MPENIAGTRSQWKASHALRIPLEPYSTVKVTYLHARFGEPEPLTQLLAHERVRIVRLVEQPLQLVQLLQSKVSPTSPLLNFGLRLVLCRLGVLFSFFHVQDAFTDKKKNNKQSGVEWNGVVPNSVKYCARVAVCFRHARTWAWLWNSDWDLHNHLRRFKWMSGS